MRRTLWTVNAEARDRTEVRGEVRRKRERSAIDAVERFIHSVEGDWGSVVVLLLMVVVVFDDLGETLATFYRDIYRGRGYWDNTLIM